MRQEGLKTYEDRTGFSKYTFIAEFLFNAVICFDTSVYDAQISMLTGFIVFHYERLAEIIKLNSVDITTKPSSI